MGRRRAYRRQLVAALDPARFLHGFCTLTDDVEVLYKCTDVWDKATERAVIWNCPEIGIDWPIKPDEAILSEKDKLARHFSETAGWFLY